MFLWIILLIERWFGTVISDIVHYTTLKYVFKFLIVLVVFLNHELRYIISNSILLIVLLLISLPTLLFYQTLQLQQLLIPLLIFKLVELVQTDIQVHFVNFPSIMVLQIVLIETVAKALVDLTFTTDLNIELLSVHRIRSFIFLFLFLFLSI